MNRLIVRVLLACMAVFTFGLVNSAPALATFSCDDGVTPVTAGATVSQSIAVPSGKSCTLTHNTVVGNITIGSGANLILQGSTIKGSISGTDIAKLQVKSDGTVPNFFPSTINGSVTVTGETDQAFLCDTTIGGTVTVSHFSGGGETFELGLTSTGACNGTRPVGNNIGGSVSFHDNYGDVYIYRNSVKGSINIHANGIGTSYIRIYYNNFKGSLSATSNTGGGEINTNNFGGNAACASNNPPYDFTNNTVKGTTSGVVAGAC